MRKISLMVLLVSLTTLLNANYQKKETSVMDHSYVSTPKAKSDNSCACANKKKKSIVNKDREKKFISATFNNVDEKTSIN